MSGIELTEEVTQTQLEALCGGDLLKAEVDIDSSGPFAIVPLVLVGKVQWAS